LIEKLKRKEQRKKGTKVTPGTSQSDWLSDEGLNARYLRELRESSLQGAPQIGVLAPAGSTSDKLGGFGQKTPLPEGTTKRTTKLYEEVKVPPYKPPPIPASEKLVEISQFDEWARVAFRNYKTLNRIQSRLFEAAYKYLQ
jgi:activating signal cointegrator complex subunit 3